MKFPIRSFPKHSIAALVAFTLCLSAVRAQTVEPESSVAPTFQVERRDVVVNVAVTDSDGNPIKGLNAVDFELRDRGKPQIIRSFREISGDAAPRCEVPDGFIGTDALHSHRNTATLSKIVWIDTENVSFEGIQASVKALVEEFSQEDVVKPAWTYISDRRTLSLFENLWVAENPKDAAEKGDKAVVEDRIRKLMGGIAIASSEPLLTQASGPEQALYIVRTLKRLRELAAEFTLRRGKKQLLWVGGGFDFRSMMMCCKPQWDLTLEFLNEADIEVSALDPEGVRPPTGFSASIGARDVGTSRRPPSGSLRPGADTDMLQVMARETGGRFYSKQNYLRGPYRSFADFTPHYYELSFSPPAESLDGKVHKLGVKVKGGRVRLRHRKSYLALPRGEVESKPFEILMDTAGENLSAATGICLGARAELFENTTPATLRVFAWLSGPEIELNPQAEGGYRGDMDVTILQKDESGKDLENKKLQLQFTFDESNYRRVRSEGFAFARDIVRHPLAHRIHLVVGQYGTRRVASVVLPAFQKTAPASR